VKKLREELDSIDVIRAYVEQMTINDPYPQFTIEPEIVKYASWLNGLMPERTKRIVEKVKGQQGWIGQELFNGLLQQFKIPNVYANPLYEHMTRMRQINGLHFDFIVPHMPERMRIISVKTIPEGTKYVRFMANVKSWKDEAHDIAVVVKIDSLEQYKAHIVGWLYADEVEELPIYDFGIGEAYWTYLDPDMVDENKESSPELKKLNPCTSLISELLKGGLYPLCSH